MYIRTQLAEFGGVTSEAVVKLNANLVEYFPSHKAAGWSAKDGKNQVVTAHGSYIIRK
jgi:hypothetical protein